VTVGHGARLAAVACACFCQAALASGGVEAKAPFFVEPGPESGLTAVTFAAPPPWTYVIDNIGTGVALFDYDLDGDLDIFQVQASQLGGVPGPSPPTDHLYRNDGKGRFTDVTVAAGLGDSAWGQGVIAGDYDNDGDPDLFVASIGASRLYRNEGNGTFREVAALAGVGAPGWSTSAAFFDYDRDGLLDLYVARYIDFDPAKIPPRGDPNHPCQFRGIAVVCGPMSLPAETDFLFRNNGDGTFTDATGESGVGDVKPSYGLGVITGDVDNDGDVDIFVANDSEPNYLFMNDGSGHFSDAALFSGVAYGGDGRAQANMGVTLGDPDADGDLDLYVTHFSHDYATLYINDGTGNFDDATLRSGLLEPTILTLNWGTDFSDLDNDGDEDLVIANGHVYPEADDAHIGSAFLQRCQVFLNDGAAHFTDITDRAGPAMAHKAAHRGMAFGDVDGDGDVDVVVTRMYEPLGFYRNDLPPGNHWLGVRLVGTRSNRDAVGARVVLVAGGRRRLKERVGGGTFESSNDPRLHFGLGGVDRFESLEIRWPSGQKQTLSGGKVDRVLTIVEPGPGASDR